LDKKVQTQDRFLLAQFTQLFQQSQAFMHRVQMVGNAFDQGQQRGLTQPETRRRALAHGFCRQHATVKIVPIGMPKHRLRQCSRFFRCSSMLGKVGLDQHPRLPGEQHGAKVKHHVMNG